MMDCTDRHFRAFLRLLSPNLRLYTEMISTGALIHGDRDRFLAFDPSEHPVALQVGGSEPRDMAACARLAADAGYDEVNINVGCPSGKVQSGRFGVCLMKVPGTVADCVRAMRDAASLPVTVKTRIGVDDHDAYEHLATFVSIVSAAGCDTFFVHARKAWLDGLSPKDNRTVPPLRYDVVRRLKADFPDLTIVLNGGIQSLDEAEAAITDVDGVMIGRLAYADPYALVHVDRRFFGSARPVPSRHDLVARYLPYVEEQRRRDVFLSHITRHLYGLFKGRRGARAWRRHLTEASRVPGAGVEVLRDAAALVPREEARATPASVSVAT